jgi:hypothetical protein
MKTKVEDDVVMNNLAPGDISVARTCASLRLLCDTDSGNLRTSILSRWIRPPKRTTFGVSERLTISACNMAGGAAAASNPAIW